MPTYSYMNMTELRKKARLMGLVGYSKLRKKELIKIISKNKKVKSPSQVAFCFLLMDKIQHAHIWEDFFDQDHKDTSNIYSHIKSISPQTSSWIKKAHVRTVGTNWCGEGLILAFVQMLKKALKNPNNKYFVLLSDTCIPLYNYSETYKKILSTPKSRMYFELENENVFEDRNDIYNGHQWVILNRKIALDYIKLSDSKNQKSQSFIKKFRKLYKDNKVSIGRKKPIQAHNSTWVGGCPDEIYPINWLVSKYKKNISKYVKNQMTTYTSWDYEKDPDHPQIFNIKTVKKYIHKICGHGHIFARKFTDDAANYIAMNCGTNKYQKSSTTHPIIIRKELVGRLGNQMFQYASALGIAHKLGGTSGTACIVDTIQEDDLRSAKDDLINVCKGPFDICKNNVKQYTVVPETAYAKYDIKPFLEEIKSSRIIEIETDMDQGFLQSYKYFENIESIIRKKFKFNNDISKSVSKYINKKKKGGYKIIGLHARRGDHLSLGYMRFPSTKYFDNAMNYFRKKYKKVKFVVATNNRSWASQIFQDKDTEVISHSKSGPEDLAILGSCDGVIMSLGTFSFWGAWLSGGPAIYYKNEFNMSHEINKGNVKKSDYYPNSWIGMK
jgi:galactoside 2-L-fucosyltransferase 1/2